MPADPSARARVVLGKLLDLYAAPGRRTSRRRRCGRSGPGLSAARARRQRILRPDAQLAVVNLTSNFAASHPSGLETETLTVLSICGTLHANLPHVTEVRFLVDGQQRPNLAGHADLDPHLSHRRRRTTGGSRSDDSNPDTQNTTLTIGVFDSGFGGLTVLRALVDSRCRSAHFAFIGDTARLPYGSKSRRTIARYAAQSARFLVEEQGAEYLVIACNTASALALDAIQDAVLRPRARRHRARRRRCPRRLADRRRAGHRHRRHRAQPCLRRSLPRARSARPRKSLPAARPPGRRRLDRLTHGHRTRSCASISTSSPPKPRDARPQSRHPGSRLHALSLLRPLIERAVPPGMKVIDSAESTADAAALLIHGQHAAATVPEGLAADPTAPSRSPKYAASPRIPSKNSSASAPASWDAPWAESSSSTSAAEILSRLIS